jgi:hypothetical protein
MESAPKKKLKLEKEFEENKKGQYSGKNEPEF